MNKDDRWHHFLSSAVEQSSEGMAIADLEGNLMYVNPAWARMHGYDTGEELINKSLNISHNQEQIDNEVKPFNLIVMERGTNTGEVGHIRKDGTPFPTLMTTTLLKDDNGKPEAILGVAKDITELKKINNEFIQQHNFLKNLIDTAQTIILVLNPDGTIHSFNPYMEAISGYKLEEVKGKDWFETFLPNQDWENIRGLFKKAIGDIQTQGNVNPIITKDGRAVYIEWYDKTLRDSEGNAVGLLSVGQDISERNEAEIVKQALIEKLQKALSEIKTLRGIIPICSHCKKIRDDNGYYQQLETYVSHHTEAQFSHGVCPDCQKKYYPDYVKSKK